MRTCALYFQQFWNKITLLNRRTRYTSLFVIIAAVGIFLVPHIAQAELDMTSVSNAIILALTRFFLWIASFLIQLALFFLKFFILLAGYNGFINANVVKFGWNIIRDVANMFFIVILLVIAFGTILGLEQYEWKKSLPKLVFAAIFVNFSNVICQLIIDVSQVFTITFLNAVAGTAGGNFINMMNFREVLALAKATPDPNADIAGDLLIGALFAMFMCFMAAAAIGSYLIVMLYRMVTLWCLIILSPLAFLFSVLPSTKSYAEEFWKEFVNHVIAAPMMVFFLWLAFATFGAGNVTDSLQGPENNSLSSYKIDDDSNTVAGQTGVSISEAASWMNLANFAVAIGFLTIGMERVQKLGVKGGDWIDKAKGFATNAFQIAAGIHLARMGSGAAMSGAKKALGFAADKVPIVGRDSLKRYGKSIAGYAKMKKSHFNIARDDKAVKIGEAISKNMPKMLGGALTGKLIGGTLTKALQSNGRAEKIASNWEKAGEDAHQRWDEEVSTSKTAAGKAKLREGVSLQIASHLSAQKKELKFAEEENRQLHDRKVTGLERAQDFLGAKAGALAERVKGSAFGQGAKKLDEWGGMAVGAAAAVAAGAIMPAAALAASGAALAKKINEKAGGDAHKESKFGKMAQETANTEIKASREKHHIEEHEAHARDTAIKDILQQAPRYQAAFYDHEQKELEEKSAGLNFREATKESALYARNLAGERGANGTFAVDGHGDVAQAVKDIAKNLAASLTANLKRGREQGMQAMDEVLKASGWTEQDSAAAGTSRSGMQRKLMTALLGRKVGEGDEDIAKAFEEFQNIHGEDRSNAILKQIDGGLKVAAADGAVNWAGLLNDRDVDASSNRIKFKLESAEGEAKVDPATGEKKPGAFEGNREYFANAVSTNINKLQTIADMVSRNQSGGLAIDEQSIAQLTSALGSLTPQSRVNNSLVDSLKKARKDDAKGFAEFIKRFEASNKSAAEALKFKLGDAVSAATKKAAREADSEDDGSGI